MIDRDVFREFPLTVKTSMQRPEPRYRRLPGWFAIHGPVPDAWKSSVQFVLNDARIAVCRGEPSPEDVPAQGASWTPVYSLEPHGPPAMPTGLVFIRFADAVSVEERREAIEQVGYIVVEAPAYAPNAAWVRASRGGMAASLASLSKLERIRDVANVEPQMLSQRLAR